MTDEDRKSTANRLTELSREFTEINPCVQLALLSLSTAVLAGTERELARECVEHVARLQVSLRIGEELQRMGIRL